MASKLALDRLAELDGTDPSVLPPFFVDAPEMQEKYPNLFDLLYRPTLMGQERLGGSISIFLDEGVLKVGVFLKTEGRRAFETISDPFQAFAHLERKLCTKGLDWRPLKEKRGYQNNLK